jgi:glycosyltransferase involved in cell wall biosynthesis
VPNTVGPQPQIPVTDTGPRMVFSGSLDYEPNVDAVRWLIWGILDRIRDAVPEAELVVAGRNPTAEVNSLCAAAGVELVADAASLDALYSRARIAVAPLRHGGGTRFKVIEAMARGAAIVATETASEGLHVDPGRELLVASDEAQFAESCISLLRDARRAAELGGRAREAWARRYSSDRAKEQIIALVERVLSSKAARAPSGRPSPAARP